MNRYTSILEIDFPQSWRLRLIGRTISHYKITSKLGEGGMGEVYRARDTRLERDVALKFLPASLQQDEDARLRFIREAKAAAAIDHPYICGIYETGQTEDGHDFIAMEFVEGVTLQEQLKEGPVPLTRGLAILIEAAEALVKAHKAGVIHRDLKPANIMLTPEGHAKVMDFGLAKRILSEDAAGQEVTAALTREGSTLGTLAYMSPEQLRSETLDERSDIFSFGVVLYELLTGVHPFRRSQTMETASAILREDAPPIGRHLGDAPYLLLRIVDKLLAKDADRRYQLIHDVKTDLEDLRREEESGGTLSATHEAFLHPPTPLWRRLMPWAAAGALAVVLIAILILSPEPAPKYLMRLAVVLPSSQQLTYTTRHVLAFSPVGTHFAYSANDQLYLRALDHLEATPISGTEGSRSPFFSPDGLWLGFWADGELKKVAISGGTPLRLCQAPNPYGASWTKENRIVYGIPRKGIFLVSAAGGKSELLISVAADEFPFGSQLLPGGQAVLYTLDTTRTGWNDAKIVVQSLETGQRKVVVEGGTDARYLSTKHLVYVRSGTLLAVPFNVETLEVNGDPVPALDGVAQSPGNPGAAQFSSSDSGSLVYVPGGGASENRLVWVDRQGAEEPIKAVPKAYGHPQLSPNGRLLALEIEGDIWVYDLLRETATRVTVDGGSRPVWTPDGKRIIFTHSSGLFLVAVDGSSEPDQLIEGSGHQVNAVSPDGHTLLFHTLGPGASDALTLNLDGESDPQSWLADAVGMAFSPNGRWIVYHSRESGQRELYVRPFPGPGGRTKVSNAGGDHPVWSASGEIFYKQDELMMAVQIQTEPELTIGRPEELFRGQYVYGDVPTFPSYDVTPDGQRFVMVKPAHETGETQQEIVLVQNWFEELNRLVPAD